MKSTWWKREQLFGVGAALLVVIALAVVTADAATADEYHVVRVVDGDTVDVRYGHRSTTRVRLLNVDAPETVDPNRGVECLGPEASQRLKELLPEGSTVHLAFDDERTDRYGRTLAGVYANGELVNAQLASEGLAVPMTVGPNTRFGLRSTPRGRPPMISTLACSIRTHRAPLPGRCRSCGMTWRAWPVRHLLSGPPTRRTPPTQPKR